MPALMTKRASALFSRFSVAEESTPVESKTASLLSKPKRVESRLELESEGQCPYCGSQMKSSLAGENVQVWLCERDRHVVPKRNS